MQEMPVSFPWLLSKAILFGHGQLCKIHVHGFQRSVLLVYLKFPASLLQRIFTSCGCFMHSRIKPIRARLLPSQLLKKSNQYSCKVRNFRSPFCIDGSPSIHIHSMRIPVASQASHQHSLTSNFCTYLQSQTFIYRMTKESCL